MLDLVRGLRDTFRLARRVREPVRFTVRQARRQKDVGRYRLRSSEVVVYLRHNTPDVNTFDQIFQRGHYQPPPQVDELLARVDRLNVLDLGANVGYFAAYVLAQRLDARVVCFEPDAANARLLRRSIEANPGRRWELVEACAATTDGEVRFTSGLFTHSRVAGTEEDGEVVPAVDVFPYAERADYVKLDIEGAEWAILDDPRFGSIAARVIALEYHEHLCPDPDPGRRAAAALEDAGFETTEADFDSPEGHGMLWAWKTT